MPKSQSGAIANAVDTIPHPEKAARTIEQIRLSLLRTNYALCIILTAGLIFGPLIASTVAFCITRSPLSLSLLSPVVPGILLLLRLRRRPEEFAFPISQNDLQIRLKELDVEKAKIEKQSTTASLPLFSWLRRLLSQSSK